MIQLLISLISFISGFFVKKKISESEGLKQQVKQYEAKQKLQNEIQQRNIDNNLTSNDDAILQFKKNRASYKSSK